MQHAAKKGSRKVREPIQNVKTAADKQEIARVSLLPRASDDIMASSATMPAIHSSRPEDDISTVA